MMKFMQNWKLKSPKVSVAALNPPELQSMPSPSDTGVQQVGGGDNQMTKFRGLKRRLAKDNNLFKESKD